MIEANGNLYKLALVDTCIISEFIKQRGQSFSKKLLLKFCEDSIPSFSIQTFKELKFAPDVYDEFFNIFGAFPSLVMKDHEKIYEEELSYYEEQHQINPGLTNLFNNPFSIENLDITKVMELLYTLEMQKKFEMTNQSFWRGYCH